MKASKLLIVTALVPLTLSLGCVQSHRAPVVYAPPPPTTVVTPTVVEPTPTIVTTPAVVAPTPTIVTPAPTVVAPVSDRPVVRVYPAYPTTRTVETASPGPTTQVVPASSDLAIADAIRKMFEVDPGFSSSVKNVQVGVYHGTVTLRGSAALHQDIDELQRRIQTIPGVVQVDNQAEVILH